MDWHLEKIAGPEIGLQICFLLVYQYCCKVGGEPVIVIYRDDKAALGYFVPSSAYRSVHFCKIKAGYFPYSMSEQVEGDIEALVPELDTFHQIWPKLAFECGLVFPVER